MIYTIKQTSRFKKQLKLMKKRGKKPQSLLDVIDMLARDEALPEKYCNHKLSDTAEYKDCWECHIEPDWLLVYQKIDDELILILFRTGTHSDLFGK